MSTEKSDAIVLRVVPFSETSLVVTLLSSDFGKLSALAKGALRPKSPFEGSLDLGCHCRVVFIKKASDSLDLLTEAKLQRRFRAGSKSLGQLYAGYYVIELLRELTEEHQAQAGLFELALKTLERIDSEAQPPSVVAYRVARFELQALKLLGHAPALDRCVSCGKTLESKKRVAFGMLSGGVICSGCRPMQRQVVTLSDGARQMMQALLNGQDDELSKGDVILGEIRGLMSRYIAHHVGHPLRMQKLIMDSFGNRVR